MTTSFHGFNEELRKRIRQDMNDKADYLATGGCKDFASYRECVGEVTGLALAERHLLDLIELAEKED